MIEINGIQCDSERARERERGWEIENDTRHMRELAGEKE